VIEPASRCFLVPARGLAAGKSRLAGVLSGAERRRLNVFLLGRVLQAIAEVLAPRDGLFVVSADPGLLADAARYGASPVLEPAAEGMNAALARGLRHAAASSFGRLAILPADLPFVTAEDVRALLSAAGDGVALAPDRAGIGTNGLACPAARCPGFAFGADSFARHAEAARGCGLPVAVIERAGLACDLDLPGDFRAWRRRLRMRPAP